MMESRQATRIKLKLNANIAIGDSTKRFFDILKKKITAEMLDISILGAGLLCKHFFPVGAVLKLRFDLPFGANNEKIKQIDVSGEIRSAISGGKGLTRLGVRFLDLNDEQRKIIIDFINEHERRKAPRLVISEAADASTKNNE